MSVRDRARELRAKMRSAAVEAYNEADGDIEHARLLLRKKRVAYGFDIATAMLLFQLAMMLWKWAKDNGYLTEISVVAQEGEPSFLSEDCFDDE
jgi:hypothetical protein